MAFLFDYGEPVALIPGKLKESLSVNPTTLAAVTLRALLQLIKLPGASHYSPHLASDKDHNKYVLLDHLRPEESRLGCE